MKTDLNQHQPSFLGGRSIKKSLALFLLALLATGTNPARAGTMDIFTYSVTGDSIRIDSCDINASGAIDIPPTIESKPVTSIAGSSFAYRTGITSVSIPSTVSSIGAYAFNTCTGLTEFTLPSALATIGSNAFTNCTSLQAFSIEPGNTTYSVDDGILFNFSKTSLISCPGGRRGGYAIPDGVTHVLQDAFYNCSKITGITVPSSATSIANGAFIYCSQLSHLSLLGNAPTLGGSYALVGVKPGFTVQYTPSATGFDQGLWAPYAKIVMGPATPQTSWLLSKGLAYHTDIESDLNQDGVDLLMAYALDLNPYQNLSGSLPSPQVVAGNLTISYFAGRSDLIYQVEAWDGTNPWSAENVILGPLNEEQVQTASLTMTGPKAFLRLAVSQLTAE